MWRKSILQSYEFCLSFPFVIFLYHILSFPPPLLFSLLFMHSGERSIIFYFFLYFCFYLLIFSYSSISFMYFYFMFMFYFYSFISLSYFSFIFVLLSLFTYFSDYWFLFLNSIFLNFHLYLFIYLFMYFLCVFFSYISNFINTYLLIYVYVYFFEFVYFAITPFTVFEIKYLMRKNILWHFSHV